MDLRWLGRYNLWRIDCLWWRTLSELPTDVRYVIVSPVRDEEGFIEDTIRCVASQTQLPREWVIVNDGSTDRTGEILDNAAATHPWIQVIHRKDRGYRKAAGGVMEAFHEGLQSLAVEKWEFLVKLDGDLTFSADYFQRCFDEFARDLRLGICGGVVVHEQNGVQQVEKHPLFHVRGATKIYRQECWRQIEPLLIAPGWDTLDEVNANMRGWTTRSLPDVRLLHRRFTGEAQGQLRNFMKNGLACYITGYHPLFMLVKCVGRFFRRPYVTASVGLVLGYVRGYVRRVPRAPDAELIRYLRRQQLRRLLGMSSIWK